MYSLNFLNTFRGFKDSRTAELMIQRARKLKYNAVKKKKLGQLGNEVNCDHIIANAPETVLSKNS